MSGGQIAAAGRTIRTVTEHGRSAATVNAAAYSAHAGNSSFEPWQARDHARAAVRDFVELLDEQVGG